jgi:hypothetical protein
MSQIHGNHGEADRQRSCADQQIAEWNRGSPLLLFPVDFPSIMAVSLV